MRLLAMLFAVGCRIGFEPVVYDSDAMPPDADPSRTYTCGAVAVCVVDCPTGTPCLVDCAAAGVCDVTCNDLEAGCTVINCGPLCELDCGDTPPLRTGATAVCR